MTRTSPPEHLNLAWHTLTHWCALLNHQCDGCRGDCRCDCRRNRTSLRVVR